MIRSRFSSEKIEQKLAWRRKIQAGSGSAVTSSSGFTDILIAPLSRIVCCVIVQLVSVRNSNLASR